ncbi:5'/3'-nucleotidase SurE [Aliikangiella marina]|uniref:5'-nucleotidase SurE n=1 Tax=Aliikangiella marina TaxID=1712262 RepID=A0A545T2Z1_9GAMM|nr:5'/3'-nucleotidase SurE [Aliikangiella marina]TQV71591.1 5'/3'-nucleotidase SurE [Aliikangiella marina]
MLNILVSNDDGADAPGIIALAETLQNEHQVTVVAPHKNRSGSSSALTLDRPIRSSVLDNGFYSVTGTPCDCVHLGSHRLMQSPPDIVIAGINRGANLGDDVLYSGTVAAAMEGRSMGYPAIAVSLAGEKCNHYDSAAQIMLNMLNHLTDFNLKSDIILNVNVPDLPAENIKGFKLTRLGCRHRADTIVPAEDPRGTPVYWIGPPSEPQDIGEGTDFDAIEQGYVSITPLVIDFTAYQSFNSVKEWMSKL